MFALVMTADAKSSDDAASYGRYMSAKSRTYLALAGYRRGSGLAQMLKFPSYSSQAAQSIERSAGALRKFMVGVVNSISTGGQLNAAKKLMNVLEFNGMTAVGVVREVILTVHPDLICRPALRLEALPGARTAAH